MFPILNMKQNFYETIESFCNSAVRFKEGLATLGVLKAMQENPMAMQKAFVYSPCRLDATLIEELFSVEAWSEPGSNRLSAERRAFTYWRDYLQDLEGCAHFFQF
jgi:hypothetical protein